MAYRYSVLESVSVITLETRDVRTYCAVMFFRPSGAKTIMSVRMSVMMKMTL